MKLSKVAIFIFFITIQATLNEAAKPNIIVLMVDDLGIGDIGCFGNTTLPTPNIDRLCNEGAKLTHHLSAAALCTPSRAAFLTGRYPIRTGLTGAEDTPPVVMFIAAKTGLPETETTWASYLQQNGYLTQAVGKWHLGWDQDQYGDQKHGPRGHGFDHFYGLPFTLVDGFEKSHPFFTYEKLKSKDSFLHSHLTALVLSFVTVLAVYSRSIGYLIFFMVICVFAITWFFLEHFTLHEKMWWRRSVFMEKYLNSLLMDDDQVIEQPIRLPKLMQKLTKYSIDFINKNGANSSQPFALYHAFSAVHTPLTPNRLFKGKSNHGAYGDSILEIDDAVGQMVDALKKNGIEDQTLIYFTSDHGSHIDKGTQGGSNSPFKGGKAVDPLEGGIRVPGIIKWPERIKAKTVVDHPTSLMDFLPTINEMTENEIKISPQIDGTSYFKALTDKEYQGSEARIIRHYCGTSLHALRIITNKGEVFKVYKKYPKINAHGHCGENKLCRCFGDDNVTLLKHLLIYDMVNDPYEDHPLLENSSRYSKIVETANQEFEAALQEINPPSQFLNKWDVMPRPWMQPCANFPRCYT